MHITQWNDELRRVHTLVHEYRSLFQGAGRWLDVMLISERPTAESLRAALFKAASHFEAVPEDDLSEKRLGLSDALRVLLIVTLLTDEHASEYAGGLTQLGTLPWKADDAAACRSGVDPDIVSMGRGRWSSLVPLALRRLEASLNTNPTQLLLFALNAIEAKCVFTSPLAAVNEHRNRWSAAVAALSLVAPRSSFASNLSTPDLVLAHARTHLTDMLSFCDLAKWAGFQGGEQALDPTCDPAAKTKTLSLRTLLIEVSDLAQHLLVVLGVPSGVLELQRFAVCAERLQDQARNVRAACEIAVEQTSKVGTADSSATRPTTRKQPRRYRKREPKLTTTNVEVYECFKRNGRCFAATARALHRSSSTVRGHVEKYEKLFGKGDGKSLRVRSALPHSQRGEVLVSESTK